MRKHIGSLLWLLAAPSLFAQNFGEITGTVSDASGAIMSGVTVTVVSRATNQARVTTTNETGNFSPAMLRITIRSSPVDPADDGTVLATSDRVAGGVEDV